jgi:glycerol-3-phosphate acyltransferase PlsY
MWTAFIGFVIAAYLLGSIPFGVMIGRSFGHVDVSKVGSGNIGATNVAREVGFKWGLVTLVVDALKGFMPVALAYHSIGPAVDTTEGLVGIVGMAALLGHQFPIYNRFKGGKGIATGLGVFLALSPMACLFSGTVFVVMVILWGYISLGSILAALGLPLWLLILGHSKQFVLFSLVIALLITFLHRGNIQRLLQGNERRWRNAGYLNRSTSRPNSSSE